MLLLFYTTFISVDLAYHELFRAKVGKGGMSNMSACTCIILRTGSHTW